MTEVDKVAKMLLEMEASQMHNEIFKTMGFSETMDVQKTRDKAIVKTNYTCDAVACDFSDALVAIEKHHPRLLKYKSKDTCTQIVNDIQEHPEDYLPTEVDGYYIHRMGQELVHLQRDGSDGKGITGLIEYNDLRKKSMDYEYCRQQQFKKSVDNIPGINEGSLECNNSTNECRFEGECVLM